MMKEKEFEGKPWDLAIQFNKMLIESFFIDKEYKVTIKIEEL